MFKVHRSGVDPHFTSASQPRTIHEAGVPGKASCCEKVRELSANAECERGGGRRGSLRAIHFPAGAALKGEAPARFY